MSFIASSNLHTAYVIRFRVLWPPFLNSIAIFLLVVLFRIAILFSTLSANAFAPFTLSLNCILPCLSTSLVFRSSLPFLTHRLIPSWGTVRHDARSISLTINVAVGKMGEKELYAALSRSTNYECMRWDSRKLRIVYSNKENLGQGRQSVSYCEYQHGKFYKVVFNDSSVYIGITWGSLE